MLNELTTAQEARATEAREAFDSIAGGAPSTAIRVAMTVRITPELVAHGLSETDLRIAYEAAGFIVETESVRATDNAFRRAQYDALRAVRAKLKSAADNGELPAAVLSLVNAVAKDLGVLELPR